MCKITPPSDDEHDDDEIRFVVPPGLFSVADALTEQHAEWARRMASVMMPTLKPLHFDFERLAQQMAETFMPAYQMQQMAEQIAGSLQLTFKTTEWLALSARLAGMRVPSAGEFVTREPEPTTAAEDEVLNRTAEELADAGITAADLDRLAVLVFLPRMMAFGGIAAGGFVTGGAGWLASLGALERFLSEIAKLRDRLAQRTDGLGGD